MPPRVARSSVSVAAPKTAKNKSKKRQLDAYSIASHSAPEKLRIRQHRLGESIDDNPRQKRRRLQDDDEDSQGEERMDSARQRRERNVTKRTGTGRKGGLDDEDVEFGSDSEGNEWRMGGVASGESESDLDSDEAFGESDEERFAGFSFRGGSEAKRGKGKPAKQAKSADAEEVDLNEDDDDDEDDEDDFGDEGVDLATMLDDQVDDALGGKDQTGQDFGEESASEEDESGSEDEASEGSSDKDDEEEQDDEERHARLQDFVEALDKKTPQDKARIMGDEDGGLTVDDLLADADLDKATLATFKPKKKSKAPQTLTAPLPKRQQDRIDREIATEKAKEQLDRWRDTVIQNRRSEFLQFPLRNPDEAEPIGKDNFINAQEDQPRTELEQSIQKIMEESGMTSKKEGKNQPDSAEQDLLKAEELATNKMPVEEVLARRAELRRARELLFREEVKAKRIAKIKSKSYRRVHRKERERQAEKERQLLDPEGLGVGMDEDEKEAADRRRAAARMGTKHRDSKWAKSLKATDRAVWDESAREGAIEQARRQEDLRRRVAGHDGSGEEMSDDESSDDDDEDGVISFKQLDKLDRGGDAVPEKGLAAMKFMRDADERRRKQNDETVQQMRREMAGEQSEEDEDESIGRAIFGPASAGEKKAAPQAKRPELEEGDLSEDEDQREQREEEGAPKQPESTKLKSILKKNDKSSGPLAKGIKDRRQREEPAPAAVDPTSEWLSGPTKSKSKADKAARQADDVAIDTSTTERKVQPSAKNKKAAKAKPSTADTDAANTEGWTTVKHISKDDNDNDSASEPEADPILSPAAQKSALYARAFAGDDVAASFAEEKALLEADEAPQETSTALPGWGSWTGANLTKREQKTAKRALHNPLHKTRLAGVAAADRKDKGRADVIVSERQGVQEGAARKGKKYLAPVLPHQFERGEEYERSLRLPIGPEWGTKATVQKNVRPRVVVRPGRVVEAIERPLV